MSAITEAQALLDDALVAQETTVAVPVELVMSLLAEIDRAMRDHMAERERSITEIRLAHRRNRMLEDARREAVEETVDARARLASALKLLDEAFTGMDRLALPATLAHRVRSALTNEALPEVPQVGTPGLDTLGRPDGVEGAAAYLEHKLGADYGRDPYADSTAQSVRRLGDTVLAQRQVVERVTLDVIDAALAEALPDVDELPRGMAANRVQRAILKGA